jgi:hypothetical protein
MPGRVKGLVHILCFEVCRKLKFLEHSEVTVDIHYVVHAGVVSSNLIGNRGELRRKSVDRKSGEVELIRGALSRSEA